MEACCGLHERHVHPPGVPAGVHRLLEGRDKGPVDGRALCHVGNRKVRHGRAQSREERRQHLALAVAQKEEVRLAQVLGTALGAENGHHLKSSYFMFSFLERSA
jgi:hypothetical protein